ncbi:unnamed protein product [Adineta steineri]|uniref:Carboxylic ester hydrolase n=1 Tax=Adineta steineri TaxID=433720 RepID=A0A818X106_9BILA|nr:unnamed protein product [Adineta steineri]
MSLLYLVISIILILSVESRIIQTPNGNILGSTLNDVDSYLGIPYGQILTRWTPAILPKSWEDTLNATAYGPICPQFGPFKTPFPLIESEDCLFLNIWVPKTTNALLPVRVWLHGGGYTAGYSNDYDGENLARLSQSIIVTINYRLGIFGFFPLPNFNIRNLGWIDQQLALQWIQENIPSFGGDKTNVMLFGQSAGGGSNIAHFIMESSWPLYSSIVLESAGPFRLTDCIENEKTNLKLLETAFPQCQSNMTCFQQLNTTSFYQELNMINWITLWPCIGETSQLREQPITLIRKGLFNKNTNILGGFNANEGQTTTFIFNQNDISISSTKYQELAEQYHIPNELIRRYDPTTTDKNYFNALSWLLGDYYGHCPNLFLFNHVATLSSSSIYVYFFIHATENWAFSPLKFNATHLTEIPYVFQNQFGFAQLTPAETNLSLKFIDYFTTFHLSKQPWLSYKIDQTILVLDIGNDGIKTQLGFDQQLIERCSFLLKYMDSDDCHGYLTEQDCSNIKHCRWIENSCDTISTSTISTSTISTSSAQQHHLSIVIFFYLINFLLFFFY